VAFIASFFLARDVVAMHVELVMEGMELRSLTSQCVTLRGKHLPAGDYGIFLTTAAVRNSPHHLNTALSQILVSVFIPRY
jgi:hypothetical protein